MRCLYLVHLCHHLIAKIILTGDWNGIAFFYILAYTELRVLLCFPPGSDCAEIWVERGIKATLQSNYGNVYTDIVTVPPTGNA